jgi:DNA gyrase subunit A
MPIESISLTDDMKTAYLQYAMSVNLGRAIPDYRDGMKPIHRRILYAMNQLGLSPQKPYMKAARVEGEVMGKYSPHGGSYGSMVTITAPWINNHPLGDGQGNWGSSTDGAASSRYTEIRLTQFSIDCLLSGLATVEMKPNYDGSLEEPMYLSAQIPMLLLNGHQGMGVGYATNIPPSNLRGVVESLINPKKVESLTPDFPSGCDVVQDEGLAAYLASGKGSIRMMARSEEGREVRGGRKADYVTLRFTNLPFGTNPEKVGEQIRKALDDGKFTTELKEIRDESDRYGDSLLCLFKDGTDLAVAKAELMRYTSLDSKFSADATAIYGLEVKSQSPAAFLREWFVWRQGEFIKELNHEHTQLSDRLHILTGYQVALANIDQVIKIIRKASNRSDAHSQLMSKFKLTSIQTTAVLELQLHRLTSLDSIKIQEEIDSINSRLDEISELLQSEPLRVKFLHKQMRDLAKRHGHVRHSNIIQPTVTPVEVKRVTTPSGKVVKIRYCKISPNCVAEQLKGAKGSTITIRSDQKFLVVTQSGLIAKVPATVKGNIFPDPQPLYGVIPSSDESTVTVVFKNEEEYRAITILAENLNSVTSKGKRLIPEGYELVGISKVGIDLTFTSSRKKSKRITLDEIKLGKLGQRGIRLAKVDEVKTCGVIR